MRIVHLLRVSLCCIACAVGLTAAATLRAQISQTADMVLDPAALLMPITATYGRAINGVAFQTERLLTYNGYQYATWYHNSAEEDMYVARRALTGNTWEVFDTGRNLDNGDSPAWDAHDVISMGISGDGVMHFSWDMHNNTLRYITSAAGDATKISAPTWAPTMGSERSALNLGGPTLSTDVTYPQFITKANGDMLFVYRTGISGNGDVQMATYSASGSATPWSAPHQIINGTNNLLYHDDWGGDSMDRNAYLNGVNIDTTGRIHVTWTWREAATGSSNHDIMYAYSDDGGDTWKNNAGTTIGTVGSPITMNSPGVTVVPLDRGNTLMNQQTQTVDGDGRVHAVMWSRADGQPKLTGFSATPAAYYHYFRDPASGVWTRTALPTSRAVGSRPDMAYDNDGNLYVAYLSPGPGDGQGVLADYYKEGDLILATASKASGYADWEIVNTDTRDFSGEPHIDQNRMLQNGVLSVTIQENDDANTGKTGTPLHVLEYNKLAQNLVWAGDNLVTWTNGGGVDWDSSGDNTGDSAFAAGKRVTFDDGAVSTNVSVASIVSPASTTFRNTAVKSFTLNGGGVGGIAGSGDVSVVGGGTVTLSNADFTYTGATNIKSGTLALTGATSISASPVIKVDAGGTFDATGTLVGGTTLSGQTLTIDGAVKGDISATNNSIVNVNSVNALQGNLHVETGSLAAGGGKVVGNVTATGGTVRVGGVGMTSQPTTVTTVVDNFSDLNVGEYTKRVVNDASVANQNIGFSAATGALVASNTVTNATEQTVFLRSDVGLAVGQTLAVDVAVATTTQQMDLGLMVSATASPTAASVADTDTRDTFNWTSVSVRPSQDSIRVNRSISGAVDTATNVAAVETTVSGLYITRTSATNFTLGYKDTGAVNHEVTTAQFTATNIGSAIGFYADLRTVGSLGSFDNLRIIDPNVLVATGSTLTVQGDYSQSIGATLALDIYTPSVVDRLSVSGNLAAGGALNIALAAGAPTPHAGDTFDVLDFTSLTGVFDSVVLPTLGSGLIWNNSLLLTTGILSVVAGLPGDYNGDGSVDAADYVSWRDAFGAVGTGLAADGNRDLHVDDADYLLWQAKFGTTLPGAGAVVTASVPEPTGILLVALGLPFLVLRARSALIAECVFPVVLYSDDKQPAVVPGNRLRVFS